MKGMEGNFLAPHTCRADQTEHCFDTLRSLSASPQNVDHLKPYTSSADRAALLCDTHAVGFLQRGAHCCVLGTRYACVVNGTIQPFQQIMA